MTIQERITSKTTQIEKLQKKFNKYAALVSAEFLSLINQYMEDGNYEPLREYRKRVYPYDCFLQGDDYSLYDAASNLRDAVATLRKYENQLAVEEAKRNTLNQLPEALIEFRDNLIQRWNRYDEWKQDEIGKEYKAFHSERHTYDECKAFRREMAHKWGRNWEEYYMTKLEDLYKQNAKDAENLILNLINRVTERVGQIVNVDDLHLDQDNAGYLIINGKIIGTDGECRVESIGAGGYNIQRYHIRVLVH